jgi:hypothetical protein
MWLESKGSIIIRDIVNLGLSGMASSLNINEERRQSVHRIMDLILINKSIKAMDNPGVVVPPISDARYTYWRTWIDDLKDRTIGYLNSWGQEGQDLGSQAA